VVNEELSVSGFFKSVCDMTKCFSTNGNDSQAFVDGIQFSNSHSDRVQVKGGAAPSATRASVSRLSCKEFKLSCSFSSGDTFTVTDTRGISVDRNVLLYDGTNYENVKVTAVVAGVSFDVSARSVVVDANVERVDFQGFHTFKIVNNTSLDHDISAFEYEPLTISPSKYMDNISSEFITEKISRRFKGLTDGSSVSFPTHTDGIQGNWMTSIYETIRQSGTVTAYDLSDIKNISITGGGSLDIKITSIRKVKVNNQ